MLLDLASEREAEARAKAFATDPRIALIREEADAIARSGHALYPNASQIDLDNLVAIARNVSDFSMSSPDRLAATVRPS